MFELSLNGVLSAMWKVSTLRHILPVACAVGRVIRMEHRWRLIHSGTKRYFRKPTADDLNSSANLSIWRTTSGHICGKFTAVDPNGNAITFDLVDGEGAEHNGLN